MYHTILVPLDGSKRAEIILPHLEELARRYEARVVFLQVIEPVTMVADPGVGNWENYKEIYEEQAKEAEVYLAGMKDRFREKGIDVHTIAVQGHVVEAIINAAKNENADLIAIASHGRSGISRVFYGSVAAGVLHRADRPLLLIRAD